MQLLPNKVVMIYLPVLNYLKKKKKKVDYFEWDYSPTLQVRHVKKLIRQHDYCAAVLYASYNKRPL